MVTEDLKVWVVNDDATICGVNEEQVVNWFEQHFGIKVESIEESRMDLEFSSKIRDDVTLEDIEIWQSVEDKIMEYIKDNGGVSKPFVVCEFHK